MTSTTTDCFPPGWKYSLLCASLAKHAIATIPMKAGERLRFLELLAEFGDGTGGISAAAVAAVAPADAISAQIIREAMTLDGDMWSGSPDEIAAKRQARHGKPDAFKVLTGDDLFAKLARLNPSLLAAINLCGHGAGQSH